MPKKISSGKLEVKNPARRQNIPWDKYCISSEVTIMDNYKEKTSVITAE